MEQLVTDPTGNLDRIVPDLSKVPAHLIHPSRTEPKKVLHGFPRRPIAVLESTCKALEAVEESGNPKSWIVFSHRVMIDRDGEGKVVIGFGRFDDALDLP